MPPSSQPQQEKLLNNSEGEAATGHPLGNLAAAYPTKYESHQ